MVIRSFRSRRRSGLTLVEVMIVLAIICILVAFLVPTISKARRAAQQVHCMGNMRQLTQAWIAYSAANNGFLLNPETGAGGAWVTTGDTEQSIRDGVLFKYCSNHEADRCPTDPSVHKRSYSINTFLNGGGTGWGIPRVNRMSIIPNPGQTFVFIEENDPRGYNTGSFVLERPSSRFVDFPGTWHDKGMCISFADGRVEAYRFRDPRTLQITAFYTSSPNNPDLIWLQERVGF